MTPRITAWEAPALLGLHRSLSEHDLYQRLSNPQAGATARGLSSYIGEGLLNWAAERNQWPQLVQRTVQSTISDNDRGFTLNTRATASVGDIDGVTTTLTALHIAGYVYSREWGKAGTVPDEAMVTAQWIMRLFNTTQHAFVILHDKSTVIQWVDRNDDAIRNIDAALAAMIERLLHKNPPPIFQERSSPLVAVTSTSEKSGVTSDLQALANAWLAARQRNANAQTTAKNAQAAFDRAAANLKAALAPGAFVEIDSMRIYHNAQSGRLLEEKTNADFF